MAKKTLLVSSDKNVIDDEGKCIINGKEMDGNDPVDEMRSYYKEYLSNHFENLVILTGAGSSIGIGKARQGKTRIELWKSVKAIVTEDVLKEFCSAIRYNYPASDNESDIEFMLSQAYKSDGFVEDKLPCGEKVKEIINKIQAQIVEDCTLDLPDINSPHQILLSKATVRKLKYPRLKIFTLNYDTLFEQSANKGRYTVIDGFSFTIPRTFNGLYFDYDFVIREKSRIKNEENYVSRVFHLYKPHGSLDWERQHGDDAILKKDTVVNPLIIYPKDSKYESSYEQPYFEMISRFQQTLRMQNVQLICIGFSFYDKHISTMIREAVESNQSFRLMIVNSDIEPNDYLGWFKEKAKHSRNIMLVAEKFKDFAEHYPYPSAYDDRDLIESERKEA